MNDIYTEIRIMVKLFSFRNADTLKTRLYKRIIILSVVSYECDTRTLTSQGGGI
jgi:hypothetical protein